MRFVTPVTAWLAVLAALSTGLAHAYIDPATGSYVLQILVAGLLGALLGLKLFWQRIVMFFQGLFSRSNAADPSAGDSVD